MTGPARSLTSRRPGIRFEAVEPMTGTELPRTDVAAFVGIAASGPVDIPVAIEDPVRFAEIFGDDVQLAWDSSAGAPVRSRLGPSVRAFFAQGGRRCHVVRVARRPDDVGLGDTTPAAETARFLLGGVLRVSDTTLGATVAVARCPGSWSDAWSLQSMVTRRPVPIEPASSGLVARSAESGELLHVRFDSSPVEAFIVVPDRRDATRESLDAPIPWTAARWFSQATNGELSLALAPASPPGVLPVVALTPVGGTALAGAVLETTADGWVARVPGAVAGHVTPGTWLVASGASSTPPNASSDLLLLVSSVEGRTSSDTDALVTLGGESAWWVMDGSAMIAAVTAQTARAEALSLSLEARHADGNRTRLDGLGFAPSHQNYWGRLPDDATRFAPVVAPGSTSLANAAPFTIAGEPASDQADVWFVPLGVPALPRDEFAQAATHSDANPLARDGLAQFDETLFIDPALADSNETTLLDDAFALEYQSSVARHPRGMHALLAIEEVALIAVPDAAHLGWTFDTIALPDIDAPVLRLVRDGIGTPVALRWSSIEGATSYVLASSPDPRFRDGVVEIRRDDAREMPLPDAKDCSHTTYWRVRARGVRTGSPWSNTVRETRPIEPFAVCGFIPLRAPAMDVPVIRGQRVRLAWAARPPEPGDVFRLETSPSPTFDETQPLYEGPATEYEAWRSHETLAYYRVTVSRDGVDGPWSRTAVVNGAPVWQWQSITRPPVDDDVPPPEESPLLATQVALLRLCAARGDVFAALHVPVDYRPRAVNAYVERLANVIATGDADRTLGFGALYHPWVIDRDGTRPPDGNTVGAIAATTLRRGAWFAPANMVLRDVLALGGSAAGTLANTVNEIVRTSRGFALESEWTLSDTRDWAAIHVRRVISLLRRVANREGNTYAFLPNDERLRRLIARRFEALLGMLFARGAFAGRSPEEGFRVVTDRTVNPPDGVDHGQLVTELRVAPSQPLAFLTVRLQQSGGALTIEDR